MKKLLFNLKSLNLVLLLIALVFVNDVKANEDKPKSNTVQLIYLGLLENNPVVEIIFDSKKEDIYTIGFRDKNGVLFYTEKIKIAKGSKKFAFNADEINLTSLTVEVKNRTNKEEEVFTITKNKSVVEETVVVKLK